MKIDYAARVAIGTKETNDDRVLVDGRILDMTAVEGTILLPAVVAVCDGCGGYDGGGVAAETVLEVFSRENPGDLENTGYLAQVLEQCARAVAEKKVEMPACSKMCTTIAGCVFLDHSMLVFHAGDSRVYRHDRWGLARMTVDHSVVQQMVDMGQITEEEARTSANRNVITRCIGAVCLPPEIYVSHISIGPGEKFLLCSDGLWEYISREQIVEILSGDSSLESMADALIETALAQGSDDNISVCICAAQGKTVITEEKPFVLE